MSPTESGVTDLQHLNVSSSKNVFFYLCVNLVVTTAQTHDVVVYLGNPQTTTPFCKESFSLTVVETILSSNNQILSATYGPTVLMVNGMLEIDLNGKTGNIPTNGDISFSPAVLLA